VLKLPRGEVYDMLIVKTEQKLESPNSFRRYDKCNMPPIPTYGDILTLLCRVTVTIAIAQPLLNFLNKDPTTNVYLVIIYTRKHGILANQKPDMLFWKACAKNVKYYKL
jgi:hypothetical protein